MRTRDLLPFGALTVAALVGCNGGSGSSKKAASTVAPIASVTTNTGTTSPITTANGPTIVKATFASVTSAGRAAKGDEVTVSFSKEVVLKASATDADQEFELPVHGNTFGAGATMRAGALKTDVIITLGKDPILRISGTFDVANVGSGDASGVRAPAAPTGNIATPTGDKPTGAGVDLDGPYTEGWTARGNLNVARGGHTATLLNDGRILIVGGFKTIPASGGNPAGVGYAYEPEIYDPLAGTFTKTNDPALGGKTGDMLVGITVGGTQYALQVARTYHTATLLDDGRVLIAGGFGWEKVDATGKVVQSDLGSAHVFDPKTNQFTLAQGMLNLPRSRHYATPLGDGTILIAGGINNAIGNPAQPLTLPTGEIFDPKTGAFAMLSSNGIDMTVPRMDGVASFDPATKTVNFVGGVAMYTPTGATAPVLALSGGAEVFDPATKKFSGLQTKPAVNCRFQAFAQAGSELWTFGGSGAGGVNGVIEGCVQNTLSGTAIIGSQTLATPRARAQAVVVGESVILIAGGTTLSGKANPELASCEVWNLDSHLIQKAPDMKNPRNLFTLTKAGNKVYAIGGFNADPGQSAASLGGQALGSCEVYSRP